MRHPPQIGRSEGLGFLGRLPLADDPHDGILNDVLSALGEPVGADLAHGARQHVLQAFDVERGDGLGGASLPRGGKLVQAFFDIAREMAV